MAKSGRKGPLAGNNLLWYALLAGAGYLTWTKVIQPSMSGSGKSPPMAPKPRLDQFGREPSKFKIPQTGVDPYSGIANDGTPTIYQPDWGATA